MKLSRYFCLLKMQTWLNVVTFTKSFDFVGFVNFAARRSFHI